MLLFFGDRMEDTQTCTTYGTDKPLHEYSLRSTVTGARHRVCKDCHKQAAKKDYDKNKQLYKSYAKRWVEANPDKRRQAARSWAAKNHATQKQLAVDYKGGCCTDCAGKYPLCVYDFHHLDPKQKDMHLAQALNARGFEFCKEELDKCILLCSNCHRIRHHG